MPTFSFSRLRRFEWRHAVHFELERGAGHQLIAGACLMAALVGISRMAAGRALLSAVLAAAAEANCWLAVCITASSTLRRRRAARAANRQGRFT